MPIDTKKLSELSTTAVADAATYLSQLLKEQYPTIDTGYGTVLRQLLITPAAMFHVLNNTNLESLQKSQSLLVVSANPELASPSVIDGITSNFLISRREATNTYGRILVVVNYKILTTIPAGTQFSSANGGSFTATSFFSGVTDADSVVSSTDRLIEEIDNERYGFIIDVVAQLPGDIQIKSGTTFSLGSPVSNVASAYAVEDFTPGLSEETNAELIDRLKYGISAKAMSDRVSITALIKSAFDRVTDVSIVGNGDPEMLRDKHNIFGIGHGGKADIYVRSSDVPLSVLLRKTATLIDKQNKIFQFSLTENEATGFYRVDAIKPVGSINAGSLQITEDIRNVNLGSADFTPFFGSAAEAVYTAYQTAVIRFIDEAVPVSNMTEGSSTNDYDVYLSYIPAIGDIQSFISARQRRTPGGDYIVRAAIPCFVAATINIKYRPDKLLVTDELVRSAKIAVAAAVNKVDFSAEKLSSSVVIDALSEFIVGAGFVDLQIGRAHV